MAVLAASGVPVSWGRSSGRYQAQKPTEATKRLHDHIERLSRELGVDQVRLFAGFTSAVEMTEPIWSRMLSVFERCRNLCGQIGLSIAIETHEEITMSEGSAHYVHIVSTDPACLKRLIRELPPEVGFNFDPGNMKAVAPEDRGYCTELLAGRISYCHLKGWRRHGNGWEAVAIGDDDLDYRSLLEKLTYRDIYLVEYEPTGDVEDGIRRSLDYLKEIGVDYTFL